MQIHISGQNIEITPALKSFTEEKMQRLDHIHHNIANLYIILHLENVTHVAEGTAHVLNTEIHASANASDMYSAIDALVDKLTTQLTKHKEKMTDHR